MRPIRIHPRSHLAVGFLLLAVAAAPVLAGLGPAAIDPAARLRSKIAAILRHAETSPNAPLVTVVTEQEVNAYLAADARSYLPVGLTAPRVTILPGLSLHGTATVDLDAVRTQRQSRGWLDPLNYLSGTVPVAVTGSLQATGGMARFALEETRVAGVPVPKVVLQELVAYYSKTQSNPRGLNLDDPYPLPARIRQIVVRPGEALVKQ